jgi:hypothetical protein
VKNKKLISTVLLLIGMISMAQADVGTPLMWAGMLHLLIGNFFIGILEGLLLAIIFKLPKMKAMGILILANHFSAWVGSFVCAAIINHISINLGNAWTVFWLMVLFTYILTLFIEFPFVLFLFRRDTQWRRKSIQGSLIIQTASYVLLFGWYWLASGTSLYTNNHVVTIASMTLPKNVSVYYIATDDGDVYKISLSAPGTTKVFDLSSKNKNDRLYTSIACIDSTKWDLMVRQETEVYSKPNMVPVLYNCAFTVASTRDMEEKYLAQNNTWMNFGIIPKLGTATTSSWEFHSGFWAIEGLTGKIIGSEKETYFFSYETPFGLYWVRNATHLPTDKLLLQLGDNQICVYDPIRRQIALLAKGRGPVAVIEDSKPTSFPAKR